MAMAANTVSQTKRNLSTLGFGVRAVMDGSLEHVILAFDYATFLMNQHVDGALVSSISFAEFKQVQTTGEGISLFFNRGSPAVFTPLSEEDGANLYQLLDNIIDNIHEILSNESSLIGNLCDSLKPKICLRHCIVTEKKFKRFKGKSKGIAFLKKPGKKKAAEPAAGQRSSTKIHGGGSSIGYMVMTEQHLLCFKEKAQEIPLYLFPLQSVEFAGKSDDNSFTFKCRGTKGTFGLADFEQKLLWMDACTKSKAVSDNEVLDLEVKSQNLIRFLGTTFNNEDEEHVGMLKRLWDASHLEEEFCLKGDLWKELGFQRDDPVSDFRATGLLGLENLVYFAEHYPELFLSMCKNQQQASEMEYPFATAGINITYLLMGLLRLSPDRAWYPHFVLHPLFFFDSNAWQELYVIVFRLFDQKWNQMQVGYMGYQEVIEATRESAEELIEKRSVMGVPAIFDMLGILRMDLPNFSTDAAQKSAKAEYSFPATDVATAASASVVSASVAPTALSSTTKETVGREAPAAAVDSSSASNSGAGVGATATLQKATKTAASAVSELTSSSPELNLPLGENSLASKAALSKSRSEQAGLSEVSHTLVPEDESLTPKPRKRRNTRSKTAVEQEEKEVKEQSSSTTPKSRRRSRSRGSVHHDNKASLKPQEDDGERSGSERSEKKSERHRRDTKASSGREREREPRERSETREKDREVRRKEREKEKEKESKERSSRDKEKGREKDGGKEKSSRDRDRDSKGRSSKDRDHREKESDRERDSKDRGSKEREKDPKEKEKEKDRGKERGKGSDDDDDSEVPLRGRRRRATNSTPSGEYERWKKTQGKELAEGFEAGEEERKLSTKQKLRNSFSLKRTSGIKKK